MRVRACEHWSACVRACVCVCVCVRVRQKEKSFEVSTPPTTVGKVPTTPSNVNKIK